MKGKHLEAEGEMDYDFVNDILFFKVADREYDYSIEFQNMVVDIDSDKFIVGIQILDASKFLRIDKAHLRKISKWRFEAKLQDKEFRIDLNYQVIVRNQVVNNNVFPIIMQHEGASLPSPQTVSTVN